MMDGSLQKYKCVQDVLFLEKKGLRRQQIRWKFEGRRQTEGQKSAVLGVGIGIGHFHGDRSGFVQLLPQKVHFRVEFHRLEEGSNPTFVASLRTERSFCYCLYEKFFSNHIILCIFWMDTEYLESVESQRRDRDESQM